MNRSWHFAGKLLLLLLPGVLSHAQFPKSQTSTTQLVFLGTGTPYADPDRSGPALAVVVNGTPYLVDCGPDVIFTPAVTGRKGALEVYGSKGLADLTANLMSAWRKDIDIRLHGLEQGKPEAYVVHPHEIAAGIVFKDANVTVTAFPVKHGSWDQAWGYRFDTPDRSIVISGDTSPAASVVSACHGCDIMVHEVYPAAGLLTQKVEDREYHRQFHTSTAELAKIANEAKPATLILTHVLWWKQTREEVVGEIRAAGYQGKVVVADDLDVF